MRGLLKAHLAGILGTGGALLCVCAGVLWVGWGPNRFPFGREEVFFVSRGETLASVVDSLETRGVIRSRWMFLLTARVMGGAERLHIGKYTVRSGISNVELFQIVRSGRGNQLIAVTIPEGARIRAQARIFARALGTDSARYARLAQDPEFARSLGVDRPTLEGYLLPETYEFSWEQDERDLLRRQVESFDAFFDDSLRARCRVWGWDVHQAVTFASIVEGEAVLPEERPIISGVYHNRLTRGMRLEADPTIQYVLEDGPRRLTYADLKTESPYNTYRYRGLPPGPVNNPGKAAIEAALYPRGNGYLFFVANGRGGHWFTRTFEEHLHYVRMYRHRRTQHAATNSSRG